MMVIGIDAQKCSHTAVTVDETGRQGFVKTVGTTTRDHLRLLKWAVGLAEERLWAIEDCRHLTRRLERDLITARVGGAGRALNSYQLFRTIAGRGAQAWGALTAQDLVDLRAEQHAC